MFMMRVGGCLDPSCFTSSIMKSRPVLMSDLRVMSMPAPNRQYTVTLGCSFSLTMGLGRITCHPWKDVVLLPFHHVSWTNIISNFCLVMILLCASLCIALVEQLTLIEQT